MNLSESESESATCGSTLLKQLTLLLSEGQLLTSIVTTGDTKVHTQLQHPSPHPEYRASTSR